MADRNGAAQQKTSVPAVKLVILKDLSTDPVATIKSSEEEMETRIRKASEKTKILTDQRDLEQILQSEYWRDGSDPSSKVNFE